MKFPIFGQKKKVEKKKEAKKAAPVKKALVAKETGEKKNELLQTKKGVFLHNILKYPYVSEKASRLSAMNQYVFKVYENANKNEIKKQIALRYDVEVKDVKIINVPGKRREIGRHSGFKAGYKKAIVILKPGNVIEQSKP